MRAEGFSLKLTSQACQLADEINRFQICRSKKEISERKCRCHSYSINAGSGEFGNRYPTTDSLRQQGCRHETWRPLSSRRLVCPRRPRSCCLRRTWVAIEPSAAELSGRHLGGACVDRTGRIERSVISGQSADGSGQGKPVVCLGTLLGSSSAVMGDGREALQQSSKRGPGSCSPIQPRDLLNERGHRRAHHPKPT